MPPKERRQDWLSVGCSPPPPRARFLPQMHLSVHDVFFHRKTRIDHVYYRREEDVEEEVREHVPLTKALFHSELPRANSAVESHACSHAIVKLTNDRDHILWHAKTGEYSPQEGLMNEVVWGRSIIITGFVSSVPTPSADKSRKPHRW